MAQEALTAEEVYGALLSYVKSSLAGVGALKGAPCMITDVDHHDGLTTITFTWRDNNDVEHTTEVNVYDGTPIYVWESGNTYHYGDLVIYESCFYRCVYDNSDVEFDPYHWQEISAKDSDYDIVPSTAQLPVRFTSADKKMYYVYNEECFYFWNGTQWEPEFKAIPQEELEDMWES